MSQHRATVTWALGEGVFAAKTYSRAHEIDLENGLVVPGSPSPSVVPAPYSRDGAMDPEAAFVAALSACHMLWFLDLAASAGVVVTRYRDAAEGTLGRIAPGKMGMTRVVLRPELEFAGQPPSAETLSQLHHEAHERCFIANSVTTEIEILPSPARGEGK